MIEIPEKQKVHQAGAHVIYSTKHVMNRQHTQLKVNYLSLAAN